MTTPNKENLTMALYGETKSGKTTFAATAPRPVFIAAAPERGWIGLPSHPNWPNITVLTVPLIKGYETISGDPNVKTPDYGKVKDDKPRSVINDLNYIVLRRIHEEYQKYNWRTVVIDTTTLLCDMMISEMSEYGKIEMGGKWGGQWPKLTENFNLLINSLQSLPLHVIWTFHEMDKKNGDFVLKRTPSMTGKNWDIIARRCTLIAYLQKQDLQNPETGEMATQRALWTRCPQNFSPPFEAGSNLEHLLPEGCYVPSWSALLKPERLGQVIRAD